MGGAIVEGIPTDSVCRRCGEPWGVHSGCGVPGRGLCPPRVEAEVGAEDFAFQPAADRKDMPLYSGCLAYFPDALLMVARLSKIGNDKHNPGEPLHWAQDKSADHADALARHLLQHGEIDPDTGLSHSVAVAWRALALLQVELEAVRAKGGAG